MAIIAPASAPFDKHIDSIFVVFDVVTAPLRSRNGSGRNPPVPRGFCVRRKSMDIITAWNDQHLIVLIDFIDIVLHQFECSTKQMTKRSI